MHLVTVQMDDKTVQSSSIFPMLMTVYTNGTFAPSESKIVLKEASWNDLFLDRSGARLQHTRQSEDQFLKIICKNRS